jgi:hypothetical protein
MKMHTVLGRQGKKSNKTNIRTKKMKKSEYLACLEQRKKEKKMQNTNLNSQSMISQKKGKRITTLYRNISNKLVVCNR